MEEFRDLPGWEGYYQVSNEGRVKSLARSYIGYNYSVGYKKERLIKQRANEKGYHILSLYRDGLKKTGIVHRLVLLTFVGQPPEGKPQGMHLDDNPSNNILANLKWGSNSENTQQIWDHKRRITSNLKGMCKGQHYCARKIIQFSQRGEEILAIFDTIRDASIKTGISPTSIGRGCAGIGRLARGYRWKYYEDHFEV